MKNIGENFEKFLTQHLDAIGFAVSKLGVAHLDGATHMQTALDITPRLINIHQAVAYSGESRATLYKEWKSGNLKFVKMGGSTRIEIDELNRYIDAKIAVAA